MESDEFMRHRFVESGDVLIWKMPAFEMADADVDAAFERVRKHGSLVLDLRGNPGGATLTLERMVGAVFDHDVPISQRVGRSAMKPLAGKTRGSKAFAGKLVVLVDGASASAAELFARVVQLEKRGTVIGDRSSGSVMEARLSRVSGQRHEIYYTFTRERGPAHEGRQRHQASRPADRAAHAADPQRARPCAGAPRRSSASISIGMADGSSRSNGATADRGQIPLNTCVPASVGELHLARRLALQLNRRGLGRGYAQRARGRHVQTVEAEQELETTRRTSAATWRE